MNRPHLLVGRHGRRHDGSGRIGHRARLCLGKLGELEWEDDDAAVLLFGHQAGQVREPQGDRVPILKVPDHADLGAAVLLVVELEDALAERHVGDGVEEVRSPVAIVGAGELEGPRSAAVLGLEVTLPDERKGQIALVEVVAPARGDLRPLARQLHHPDRHHEAAPAQIDLQRQAARGVDDALRDAALELRVGPLEGFRHGPRGFVTVGGEEGLADGFAQLAGDQVLPERLGENVHVRLAGGGATRESEESGHRERVVGHGRRDVHEDRVLAGPTPLGPDEGPSSRALPPTPSGARRALREGPERDGGAHGVEQLRAVVYVGVGAAGGAEHVGHERRPHLLLHDPVAAGRLER